MYAYRTLSVLRGQCGTAAASATSSTTVSKHCPPGLIRDLNIAEALNRVLQETSGYARTAGSGEAAMPAPGAGLADLWDEAETVFGGRRAGPGDGGGGGAGPWPAPGAQGKKQGDSTRTLLHRRRDLPDGWYRVERESGLACPPGEGRLIRLAEGNTATGYRPAGRARAARPRG